MTAWWYVAHTQAAHGPSHLPPIPGSTPGKKRKAMEIETWGGAKVQKLEKKEIKEGDAKMEAAKEAAAKKEIAAKEAAAKMEADKEAASKKEIAAKEVAAKMEATAAVEKARAELSLRPQAQVTVASFF